MASLDDDQVERIIGAVKVRLGVSLSKDDPLFSLVVINDEIVRASVAAALQDAEKLLAQSSETLQRTAAQITVATDRHKVAIADHAHHQVELVTLASSQAAARNLSDALDAQLVEFTRTVQASLRAEVITPLTQMVQADSRRVPRQLALSVGCAAAAAIVAIVATLTVTQPPHDANSDLGAATATAWGRLDGKARALINAERKP